MRDEIRDMQARKLADDAGTNIVLVLMLVNIKLFFLCCCCFCLKIYIAAERAAAHAASNVKLEGDYAVDVKREQYASMKRDKKQREAAALAKLKAFSSKLKSSESAATSSTTTTTASTAAALDDSYLRCSLHNKKRCETCFPDIEPEDGLERRIKNGF